MPLSHSYLIVRIRRLAVPRVFYVGYLYLPLLEGGIEMDVKYRDCVGWIHLSPDRQEPVASASLYVAALLIVGITNCFPVITVFV